MLRAHNQQRRSVDRPKLQAVVRNVTAANVVEFDFVYGDPDLTVELVLPAPAFRDFCLQNACLVTAVEPARRRESVRFRFARCGRPFSAGAPT